MYESKNIGIKSILLRSFILLIILSFFSCCKTQAETIQYKGKVYQEGDTIKVRGHLASIGNEPFAKTVLVDASDDRFIIPDKYKKKLRKYSADKIEIKGVLKIVILTTVRDKKKVVFKHLIPKRIKEVKSEK